MSEVARMLKAKRDSQIIRETIMARFGRTNAFFLPLPDGTAHLDPGMSQLATAALAIYAAKSASNYTGIPPYADMAKAAIAEARIFCKVVQDDWQAELDAAKAAGGESQKLAEDTEKTQRENMEAAKSTILIPG